MTATIWEHYYKWYVDYRDKDGNVISQEWYEKLDDAKTSAKRWCAYIIKENGNEDCK